MLHELLQNVTHNLFKPLLLFFYLGFLIPLLKIRFEFPYVIYQGLTMYLLLAIGWHGGQELANIDTSYIDNIVGFLAVGFVLSFVIGFIAHFLLGAMTSLRRVDKATVAGYYGSASAGTFATCVGVLTSLNMAFDAYMPVMLAVMEIPGCLVALYLVGRLRIRGMNASGLMPDEIGRYPGSPAGSGQTEEHDAQYGRGIEQETEFSLEKREHPEWESDDSPVVTQYARKKEVGGRVLTRELFQEVFLNPGLALLAGGIIIGFIGGLQGSAVVHDDNMFFIVPFQGVLCLFLLEMGMVAARELKDLKSAGIGFIIFGLLAPNLFALLGISVAHGYSLLSGSIFEPGTYVLFGVLCASASYIAVPAVQRLAIPEASPTLPLAAALGLTFTYNVTIGIPVYCEIAKLFT